MTNVTPAITATCVLSIFACLALAQSSDRIWINPELPIPPSSTATLAPTIIPASRQRALDLIQNSHSLNQQLTLNKQALRLMRTQIEVASRLDLNLARAWAKEAFERTTQLDKRDAFNAEISIATILRQADPEFSLRLFAQIDPSEVGDFSPIDAYFNSDPYRNAARSIFMHYGGGQRNPQKLRAFAEEMGSKGFYPYQALMLSIRLGSQTELQSEMFAALLAHYQSQSTSVRDDADFATMLLNAPPGIPTDEMKTAVEVLTGRILRYEAEAQNDLTVTLSFRDSAQTVSARGAVEIALLKTLPVIKKFDPLLAKRVIAEYPNLATAVDSDSTKWKSIRFGNAQSSSQSEQLEDDRTQTLEKLQYLLWTDPKQGRKAAESIPDPTLRAEALIQILQEHSDEPDTVKELSDQITAAARDSKDEKAKFYAALASLFAASANKDVAAVNAALTLVFSQADKLTNKAEVGDVDALGNLDGLQQAVSESIRVSAEPTIGFIYGLTSPYARGTVMTWAASGLVRGLPSAQARK